MTIPNVLNQAAKRLGLHTVLSHEGEDITAVLVYQRPGDNRAIVTWERGRGIVRRLGLTWVACSLGDAESTMVEAQRRGEMPLDPDEPEPCECDQVQRLRQERDDARSARDRAVDHAMEAERTIARCLRKMPADMEHGGCLETAVDLLCRGMLMPLGRGAEIAQEYDRLVAEYGGASRDLGEFGAPWVGQDAAEHGTKPDNPLDDPRMDGETWIWADVLLRSPEWLDAWPAWERWNNGCNPVVVVHPTYSDVRDSNEGLAQWRPLRLPGMNERGEIAAKDMTPEHFARVNEWQWTSAEGWRTMPSATIEDVDPGGPGFEELWRPAIFAKLDEI